MSFTLSIALVWYIIAIFYSSFSSIPHFSPDELKKKKICQENKKEHIFFF